jgi:hypothetical protein
MQLIFNSLPELQAMIEAMGYVHRNKLAALGYSYSVPAKLTPAQVKAAEIAALKRTASLADEVDVPAAVTHMDLTDADLSDVKLPEQQAQEDQEVRQQRRKRRTKAEIEAARSVEGKAFAPQDATGEHLDALAEIPPANPLDNLKSEAQAAAEVAGEARDTILAQAALFDGTDKLAQLNEARAFIEAHGFPAYNETMKLADVPPNIAGHTPEQVSRHRAAMAWLYAPKTGG